MTADTVPTEALPSDAVPAAAIRRWSTGRALLLHGVLAVWIPGCALACWWQVTVAMSGDALGWVYSVMWPCFAVFGTVVWWNLIHDDPDTVGARGLKRQRLQSPAPAAEETAPADDAIARAEAEDAELAAYNAYLAELGRGAGSKTWRQR